MSNDTINKAKSLLQKFLVKHNQSILVEFDRFCRNEQESFDLKYDGLLHLETAREKVQLGEKVYWLRVESHDGTEPAGSIGLYEGSGQDMSTGDAYKWFTSIESAKKYWDTFK